MKLFIFLLFLFFLCAGLSPQLRTRYTPLPSLARVRRRVVFVGRRRVFFVGYMRIGG